MTKDVRVVLSSEAKEVYDYLNENFGKSKIEIVAFILNIMDHKKYNKLFGYK